jgi:hypothetical protein
MVGITEAEVKAVLEDVLETYREGVLKGEVFNEAVGAGADIFDADLTPTYSPTTFRIYAAFDGAAVLSVTRTRAEATVTEQLNAGAALIANCAYAFDIVVTTGDSINLQYGGAHTALTLKVVEIVGVPS